MNDMDKAVYMIMTDPNNAFMHQIKYGGDEFMQEMYRRDIWKSIQEKKIDADKSDSDDKENFFLNSLNQ